MKNPSKFKTKKVVRNLVAKHAKINRPATHKDRKNDYQRLSKHRPTWGDVHVGA